MDQSANPPEMESNGTVTSQINSTVAEVPDESASQTAIIFDVSTSIEDKTQETSQIENIVEEESLHSQTATAFDVSVSMETSVQDDSQIGLEADNITTVEAEYHHVEEESFFKCKVLELGRYLWQTDNEKQCYTKGCMWSPDGTCCLVPVHLDGMHLVELPADLYEGEIISTRPVTKLASAVHVKEGGTVYDFAWYPFMNSQAPETCCWLASRQHEPMQIWDAFNGDLRATYRGYNDVDEIEAAISVAFSCDGQHVLGGYKKCIRIFDTDVPGRSCIKLATKQAISCFALTPNSSDIITTGSWNGVINLYDQRVPHMGSLSSLFGHTGGVTFLKYSNSGEMLFSGARKDNSLCMWDMRNFSEPVAILNRSVSTNQRVYFDLSPQNEWLMSGDTDGLLRIWNLRNIEQKRVFRLHGDSCNGVTFHPSKPIIATSAGQYHFVDPEDEKGREEKVVDYENSLIFWWIAPRDCK